jgi:predicted HAD superfamily Cof-like phosphohydrolase
MMRSSTAESKLYRFHNAFDQPTCDKYPSKHTINKLKALRTKLITEEYKEVLNAIEKGTPDEVLKELCDLVYVCVGFAVTYGWSFDTAFNRVHTSNMSKLDEKGKPTYREDGKVAKSSMYIPTKLKDLV